jgi:hypothetical protein
LPSQPIRCRSQGTYAIIFQRSCFTSQIIPGRRGA